jgi:hypothetical protein
MQRHKYEFSTVLPMWTKKSRCICFQLGNRESIGECISECINSRCSCFRLGNRCNYTLRQESYVGDDGIGIFGSQEF